MTKESVNVEADLIVGCDGAYSAVRASLLKDKPIDFSQSYISSYYLELQIPAGPQDEYLLPPNHLHIWPRGNFMMIALPNQDHTFTCTLFMPLVMFEAIKNEQDLLKFFQENFNDSIELIGK
jgi:kynurenine 3-monooxygenase